MKMKGILVPYFSMKYETESVEQLFQHLCLVVCPSFYDWLCEFDNAEHKAMLKLLVFLANTIVPIVQMNQRTKGIIGLHNLEVIYIQSLRYYERTPMISTL